MRSALAAFVIAAFMAAILTPLVRRFALHYGAVAVPGGRDVHVRVIPRLGGLAICVALFVPIIGLFFVESIVAQLFQREVVKVVGLLTGGVIMCAVGVLDDTKGVRSLYKLYVQIACATLAFFCGFQINLINLPLIGDLSMGIFALPVTLLWIVGITNAVNLIDGLDGLAAGVVFFAGLTNLVVATISGVDFVALIMASMLGAVVGFLFYNFNPARIFMGDSGSYLLGYLLAVTSLAGMAAKASTAVSLLVPIVALGVPIFDTLFAMVRRFLEKRPMFSPDRGHLHHKLLDAGVTHRRAVLIIYGLSVVFTIAAIGIYIGRSWQIGIALLTAVVVVMGLVRFVGLFSHTHMRNRQRARLRGRITEKLRHVVPGLPVIFAAAESPEELFEELGRVAEKADLRTVELIDLGPGESKSLYHWDCGVESTRRIVAAMTYPVGHDSLARAELTFTCVTDFEDVDVSPQTDILLQIVSDLLAQNLERLGSEAAPRQSLSPDSGKNPDSALGTRPPIPPANTPSRPKNSTRPRAE
ncbi:undecaprenyl/decaprenyl-phosphate alpha-N-acetylglucosaminyl 1-phosphate transferase [Endomicrobium sp. AH-315-J14]|nr:undecaprenyl/decaprenyl-phosphate alpha-N-acetylglucosaminyl 1-phosphate transferase [Endomicrobium sp. AH-315-J14]